MVAMWQIWHKTDDGINSSLTNENEAPGLVTGIKRAKIRHRPPVDMRLLLFSFPWNLEEPHPSTVALAMLPQRQLPRRVRNSAAMNPRHAERIQSRSHHLCAARRNLSCRRL